MGKRNPQIAFTVFYIYLSVSVGGASILAIEILGTRVLGPFYGVSLYLWSALITITLAALSLGYAIGGYIADRRPTLSGLGICLASSGLWLLIIPVFKYSILKIVEPLGLRLAVLVGGFLLFFPPLMALGMVSPYAIKLKTKTLGELGRSAGNLFAISTIASVIAAILTGYYLIPHIGVSRLTLLISIILIFTGLIALIGKKRSLVLFLLLLAILTGIRLLVNNGEFGNTTFDIVQTCESPYGEITIVDRNDSRFLLIDGAIHTEVDKETFEPKSEYVDVMDIVKDFFDEPGEMLLIGLGGGSIARRFHEKGWKVDAVEIDPYVIEIAKEYFGFSEDVARVYKMDGRRYLNKCEKKYDVIILDAFGSSYIPFHLVTRESFQLASSRLKKEGILAANIITAGWRGNVVLAVCESIRQSLTNVLVLPISEPPNSLGNVVILASRRELTPLREPPIPSSRFSREYTRFHAWENRFSPPKHGGIVLTDDLNPVDIWAEQINLANRKRLHNFFRSLY